MTWIKICGTTNLEDALLAVDAGADALGFVFYEKSPRNITPEVVAKIVAKLPLEIQKVGVFAGTPMLEAARIADICGLTKLQFHVPSSGGISREQSGSWVTVGMAGVKKVLWVFSAHDLLGDNPRINVNFASFVNTPFDTVLLDSSTPQQPGGTGRTFDWEMAAPLVNRMNENVKVVVAGGLTPTNVIEAIRILKPWGVDVVSGVEASPGKKDPRKVRAFIKAVRQSEKIN
jgi:phosphoribosylanthranilate isomerase